MPETNSFLSGLFSTIGDAWLAKQQQKHTEELDAKKSQMAVIQAAIPNMADPNQGLQALMQLAGGGKKGKGGQENPGFRMLQTVVNASTAGKPASMPAPVDSELPGLPNRPSAATPVVPPQTESALQLDGLPTPIRLLSPQDRADMEMRQFREKQNLEHQHAMELEAARGQNRVDVAHARPGTLKEGTKATLGADIPEDQRPADGFDPKQLYIPLYVGSELKGWRAVESPKTPQERVMAEKIANLKAVDQQAGKALKSDADYERLARVETRLDERSRIQERQSKFSQYMAKSAVELQRDNVALQYMQENQPLLLESKRLNIDLSKATIATARALADALTKNPESSVHGQDPAAVASQLEAEGFAPPSAAAKAPAPDAAKPPATKFKAGDTVTLKNGSKVKITVIRPDGTFDYEVLSPAVKK